MLLKVAEHTHPVLSLNGTTFLPAHAHALLGNKPSFAFDVFQPEEPLPDSCTNFGERRSTMQLAQVTRKKNNNLDPVSETQMQRKLSWAVNIRMLSGLLSIPTKLRLAIPQSLYNVGALSLLLSTAFWFHLPRAVIHLFLELLANSLPPRLLNTALHIIHYFSLYTFYSA